MAVDAGATRDLLERQGELSILGGALGRARSGGGRVVVIEGPAGIGKTRLLAAAADDARAQGFEVLAARGGELEAGYGYGVVRQLLEAPLARASQADRAELLSGAATLAASVFAARGQASAASADSTQAVLHGLYWLVANLAERAPLMLAVDDVQWADGPSLRFLLYLARRLEAMPVMLALTLRTGETAADPELLRALRLEAHPPLIEPAALSLQAARSLTAVRLGDIATGALGRACHDATGGNPFLLTELLHQLGSASQDIDPAAVARMGSERIAAAILLRMGRLGPPAAALVRAASVLGESAGIDTAAALAGLDATTAAGLADALARAQILEPQAGHEPLRFVHPLVRSAVYEDTPRSDRARLHAEAAELLARRRGGVDGAALHLLRSEPGGNENVVELLREAARGAISRGAPETATEFLRRADREPPADRIRPDVLLELGTAAARAGQPDGLELLREAFELADGQPARARAGIELGFWLGVSRDGSLEAIAVFEHAREGLDDEDLRTSLDGRLLMFASSVPVAAPLFSARIHALRAALERSPSDAPPALLSPLTVHLALTGTPLADLVRLAEQALAGGALMRRDIHTESDLAIPAVFVLIAAGRLGSAQHHLDGGVAHARAHGSPFAVARIVAARALVALRRGDLRAAEADADSALSVVAAWGIPHAVSTAVLTAVRLERGDVDGAHTAMEMLASDPALLEVAGNQIVREVRAALLAAEGNHDAALGELIGCGHWQQRAGAQRNPVTWRAAAALINLQLGAVDEARELARQDVEQAREFGAAPRLGVTLRALGLVEGGSRGVTLLEEAVALLAPSEARLDHARALVDLGALLRRAGGRKAATERLRTGMDLADRCGATVLVGTAAAELRLAGARPRRIAVSGRDSLTPAERRVTDLAVQGMSNKQIAQALFVTLRTVEMHLSSAYRKLDISAREQLRAALGAD